MEFEFLRMDLHRWQSETNDLAKRVERVYFATPYNPYDSLAKFVAGYWRHLITDACRVS